MKLITLLISALLATGATTVSGARCDNEIFCSGSILRSVQQLALFPDDKTFVDRVIDRSKVNEEEFRRKWGELTTEQRLDKDVVSKFIQEYTLPPGADITTSDPTDWSPTPTFLENVPPSLVEFASDVHTKWKGLLRTLEPLPYRHSSLLPLPHPFMVAGGRFRESYNWDSFWINEGLFVSEMPETSKQMIKNHLFQIENYGYVPNGARIYYLNRSQPPLLSSTVWNHYTRFGDSELMKEAFPLLLKEYDYWMSSQHVVSITDTFGASHLLNRYNVDTSSPRPESWLKDFNVAKGMKTEAEKEAFYKHAATAAESGWDFSSRWLSDFKNLKTIRTADIVPVDLNAILFNCESKLALIARELGEEGHFQRLVGAKQRRGLALYRLLWNSNLNTWFDYDLVSKAQVVLGPDSKPLHFLSQYLPIWAGASHLPADQNEQILKGMVHRYMKDGGLPTSNQKTGEQWDGDNVWAPLVWFIAEGLAVSRDQHKPPTPQTDPELFKLVNTWVSATYCSWASSDEKLIYEKYDARTLGKPGGDGEYPVQTGFGWSNGLTLHFLERYGDQITPIKCPKYHWALLQLEKFH